MRKKLINDINVTPFIDIMLVLLVIFMITSPMLVPEIQVELPKTNAGVENSEDKTFVVTISSKGKVYLQDKITSLGNLKKQLTQFSKNGKNIRIFVRGDKEANYEQIIKTISVIQNSGFTKIALITDYDNA